MTKSPWSDQSQGGASARRSLKPGSPGPSWGHGAVIAANGGDWYHGFLYVSIYLYIYIYIYIYILGMEKSSQLTKSIIFQRGRKTTNQIGAWYFWVSSIGDVFLCVEQVWPLACFGTSKTTTWDSGSRTQPSESAIGIVKQAWERLGDLSGAEITHSLGP
jgi:hypothetical protein